MVYQGQCAVWGGKGNAKDGEHGKGVRSDEQACEGGRVGRMGEGRPETASRRLSDESQDGIRTAPRWRPGVSKMAPRRPQDGLQTPPKTAPKTAP